MYSGRVKYLREHSCIEPYSKGTLCRARLSYTYRDSLINDLFNVKVFVFVRNKIHSAHMELMIVLGLYDLLSFHIIS